MAEQEKWKWQEPGTTWKGVGVCHIDSLIDFLLFRLQNVKMKSAAGKLKIEFLAALFRYL